MRFWFGICLAFLIVFPSRAQAPPDAFDRFAEKEMTQKQIPGLALAILRNGRPIKVGTYGFADVELNARVKPDTLFQSASVGKQFTAALVQLLAGDGKLSLDDKLSDHLSGGPAVWDKITVRHLLTHTSGLGGYPEDFNFRRDRSEAELVQLIARQPLAFEPGTDWKYSNLGYVLLGAIARSVTGRFYGELLDERIFVPAGMKSARIMSEADIIPGRASGYRLEDGKLRNQEWVAPTLNTTADGALYVSILDLVRWEQALSNRSILSPAQLAEAWRPFGLAKGKPTYGFGWALSEDGGARTVEHGGQWQGFSSQITRYPDRGLTVIMLANLARLPTWQMAYDLARIADKTLSDPDKP